MTPKNNQFLFTSLKAVFLLSALALVGCADLLERGGELTVSPQSTYVVKFDTGSGSALQSQTITVGGLVAKPANPSRSGYTFGGWYTDQGFSNAFSFTAAITENLTLYAKWNLLTDRGGFTNLKAAGNNSPVGLWSDGTTMWVADNVDLKIYAYNLSTKERDSAKDFNTLTAAGNASPTGIWSDGTTMWVADYIDDKLYAYRMGDKARDRAKDFDPLDAGNNAPWGIWSDGTTMWVGDSGNDKIYAYRMNDKQRDSSKDFNTLSAAGNTEPYGIWSDGTTVWVADYEDDKLYAYRMSDKARDPAKDFNPLKAAGNESPTGLWSDGTTMWVVDYDDGKIYAYHTVSFEVNGGSAVSSQRVAHGTRATKPSDPNRSGYVFQGWYTDRALNTAFDFNTAITGSPTLYAKWGKVHTITFITNTATPSAPAFATTNIVQGGKVIRPTDPTRTNSALGGWYTFGGWYTDQALNNAFNFNTAITANLTLYAKWLTTYTVTFITNSGAPAFATTNIAQGGKIIRPADPTRSGSFTFEGWFGDSGLTALFNFNTAITGNLTLYAKWREGWPQLQKLLASDGANGDEFGRTLAVDGNTLVVGAEHEDSGGTVSNGAVYVFTNDGTGIWREQAKLTASDKASGDRFGRSVAIAGDTVVVGAFDEDSGGKVNNGAAYVFTRSGTSWSQQAKLLASDGASGDKFGRAVTVDGNTLVVGAYYHGTGGAAYVFTRSTATTWSQQAKLVASDGASGDLFGISVALSGDTVVVGAFHEDSGGKNNNGAAYVFTRSGTSWSQQAKLLADDGASGDYFGVSVAVDGDTIAVGAYLKDIGINFDKGAAYVFTRSGSSWSQQPKITASDGTYGEHFGGSIALSGDTIAVGAPTEGSGGKINNGAAYVFTRSGGLNGSWSEQAKLTANDKESDDLFGWSIALSANTLAVGTRYEDSPGKTDNGAVYLFKR